MAERDKPHIIVRGRAKAEPYTRPPRKIKGSPIPSPKERLGHATALAGQLQDAEIAALALREQQPDEAKPADGIYITFESFPDVELALQSLDPRRGKRHPELVAGRTIEDEGGTREQATVFVPDGKLGYFLTRVHAYADTTGQERPKNRNLIDRIASIGLASLEQLWTDPVAEFPKPHVQAWWELWLRRRDGNEERAHVEQFAQTIGAQLGSLTLGFPDRTVVLIRATAEQLSTALSVLDDLAEVRQTRSLAALLSLEPPAAQAEWVNDLAER